MTKLLTALLTIMLMASSAYAHNGMEHVMGTITNVTDNSITVTTTDGRTETVTTNAETRYMKMDAVIALKDIKAGDHVVIHATKKDNQLTAAEVKIGVGKMQGKNSSAVQPPQ